MSRVAISPQVTSFMWAEDCSGYRRVVCGRTVMGGRFDRDGTCQQGADRGELLSEAAFAAGEVDIPLTDALGISPDNLLDVLATIGFPPEPIRGLTRHVIREVYHLVKANPTTGEIRS